jgi:hypothetical protein
METKQTAIDWLIVELGEYFPHEIGGIHLMVEKAKQMERQQIIDANDSGFEDGVMFTQIGTPIYDTPEQYYNETYGKQDKQTN